VSLTGAEHATVGRVGSSPVASTNENGLPSSASKRSSAIDWTMLSARAQAILRTIAVPISNGFSLIEIGRELGISQPSVLRLLGELRDELERLPPG